jgi:hypothetical protein
MEKIANYTAEQEAMIRAAAADGPLDLAKATALATAMGKKPRSVIAKAVRMELPYAKRVPTTKTGDPIARKEQIVANIRHYIPDLADGLEGASKASLMSVLVALTHMAE